jgi:sugar phosphate isomerase/epimerase
MRVTRREFGKAALVAVPGTLLGAEALSGAGRPDSRIDGVQVGVITYSYRSMPDQSAEAVLRYIVDSGISAVELMGGPIEAYAGAPATPRGGRAGPLTPEARAEQQERAATLKAWRLSQSMDRFKALRRMFNDAGVTVYATKMLSTTMSDEELEYVFDVAEALGAHHTTLELPKDPAALKRIGDFAMKRRIYAGYHTHLQGTLTAFDQAFALSPGNMANVDFGHYVAAGSGDPVVFLEKFHDRICSFHLKDRRTPENGQGNVVWGQGDTPIARILHSVRRNRYTMPATIELEYPIPEGSDAVAEVRRCLEFCRRALAEGSGSWLRAPDSRGAARHA